jgi:hypothetical protein
MLAMGSMVYVTLIHRQAWRNLRGRAFARYLVETAGMVAVLVAMALLLPRAFRERAWL